MNTLISCYIHFFLEADVFDWICIYSYYYTFLFVYLFILNQMQASKHKFAPWWSF